MKASEYKAAVAVTGLRAADIEKLFEVAPSIHRGWAAGTEAVPAAVSLSLLLMLVTNTNARQAELLTSDIRPIRAA